MPRTNNIGTCELCGQQTTKFRMPGHITSCTANHDASGPTTSLVQFRFESPDQKEYWLYVEARPDARLEQLDALLRDVWLECCGHLSAFELGGNELDMKAKIGTTFGIKGRKFSFDYDFGSTTTLSGQVLGTREGSRVRKPVRLLARNDPLNLPCDECTQTATFVCGYCLYMGEGGVMCNAHVQDHECESGLAPDEHLPVVNSPRMGVCGYVG